MALLHSTIPRIASFTSFKPSVASLPRPVSRRRAIQAACVASTSDKALSCSIGQVLRVTAAGVLASGLLWMSPLPAVAEMQTVSPQMVTQMAKPLPKQVVQKGRVWAVLVGGAIILFGTTLVVENIPAFFPAISRANSSMKEVTKRLQEAEEREKKEAELMKMRKAEFDTQQRQLASVQQGMKEAKAKVLAAKAGAPPPPPPVLPKSVAAAAAVAPAEAHSPVPVAEAEAPVAVTSAPAAPAASSSNVSTAASTSNNGQSYRVVEGVSGDMGAVAWSASPTSVSSTSSVSGAEAGVSVSGNGSAAAATVAAAGAGAVMAAAAPAAASEEDAESLARLARLQGFVSNTMGSKGAMKAMKSQSQRQ